jgi:uncharacterized RDD family membrane protein YckC
VSQQVGPIFARQDYAGFIRRSLALFLDFVLYILTLIIVVIGWQYLAPPDWQTQAAQNWIVAIIFVAWWLYMMGMRLSMNGTLGYRFMRIRYAYILDEKPTLLAIAFRSVVAVGLMPIFIFVFVDHLWILCDKRKQAWHDKLSGFYVIKTRACPLGKTPVVRRVANVMGMSFVFWEPLIDDTPPPYAKALAPVPPPVVGVHGHERA